MMRYMKAYSGNANIKSIMKEFRQYQHVVTKRKDLTTSHPEDMRSLLPERSLCDDLIRSYFQGFEKVYRILHQGDFLISYDTFWGDTTPSFGDFLSQLLLVLVLGDSTLDQSRLCNPSAILYHVEAWLNSLPSKRSSEISVLQIHCLILLAQQNGPTPDEKKWNAASNLARIAFLGGLHLDPSQFHSLTIYHAELRRRLWYTIMEFDIQMSIVMGVPPTIRCGDFNCRVPANIDDVNISENTTHIISQPLTILTDTYHQVVLANTVNTRL